MNETGQQLVLPVGIRTDAAFDNYFGPRATFYAQFILRALAQPDETLIWVAGGQAAGKSHLAAASLHALEANGRVAIYLSLAEIADQHDWVEHFLEAGAAPEVLILDDLHQWLTNAAAERAMFRLFNHFKIERKHLLVTANVPPAHLPVALPDLASRLRSAQVLSIAELSDEDKQHALMRVASERGMAMNEELATYIIRRSQRDFGQLLALLGELERASLIEQRKLTVPFAKKVFNW